MSQVNPPHPHEGIVHDPSNSITAVFPSLEQVRRAAQALAEAGFDAGDVEIYAGRPGAERLEQDERQEGPIAEFFKFVASFSDDDKVEDQTHRALRAGGSVIGIAMRGREDRKDQIARLLHEQGAVAVHYWGPWTTERL
jgi:hypothetical protein